ncbi:TIGR02391 family protein [Nonomuraea sp. NPDC059194]|uniref:TIGR02391 family protein n=1 Tax=Nonomuraea sp. NPDC059194 TaxID=3346764 RepID=UPI0036AF0F00
MTLDTAWARQELKGLLDLIELRVRKQPPTALAAGKPVMSYAPREEIIASVQVGEQILDRILPGWRSMKGSALDEWKRHREATQRALVELDRREEIAEKLGDNAPRLNAQHLHPWVWEPARPYWTSGFYREAIRSAAVMVNAETSKKVGRVDISETDLFKQAFSVKDPEPGKPRLRLRPNDGSQTWISEHSGVMAFAEGCYRGIRNPSSHVVQDELPEFEALEQLAAFSVLARWVDSAAVVEAP